MPSSFIYARKSPCPESIAQAHAGNGVDSLEQQEALCRRKAEALAAEGVPFAAIEKEHESAAVVEWRKRPKLQALLAQMHPGDHLIVWRLDRLESNFMRLMDLLNRLIELKIDIHVLQFLEGQPIDLGSAMGRAMVGILAMARDMWVGMISEATKDALRVRQEQGQQVFHVTLYGRVWVETNIPTKRNPLRMKRFAMWDQHQCDLIREMFYRRDICKETIWAIAKDFNRRDERTQGGDQWAPKLNSNRLLSLEKIIKCLKWYRELRARGQDLPTAEQIAEQPYASALKFPPPFDGPYRAYGPNPCAGPTPSPTTDG